MFFSKSIRWRFGFLIVFCWLLPMSIIIVFSFTNLQRNSQKTAVYYVRAEIDYALALTAERFNTAIALSRKPSYDKKIELTARRFSEGEISENFFYTDINAYMQTNFYLPPEISFAVLDMECYDELFYTNSNASRTYFPMYRERFHDDIIRFSKTLDTNIDFCVDSENNIYLVRNLLKFNEDSKSRERIGTLIIQLDYGYMFQYLFENPVLKNDAAIMINDTLVKTGSIISDASEFETDDKKSIVTGGKTYVYNSLKTRDYMSYYCIGIDNGILYKEYRDIQRIIITVAMVVTPAIVILILLLYRGITSPIKKLIVAIKVLEIGQFGIQVEQHEGNEFKYLFNAFNNMSNALSLLFKRVYKEELAAKDAKIIALQSQINPHFLGNTLELMNWRARMNDGVTVSKMIEALSTMLDYSMDRTNTHIVALSEELMVADAYLYIISQRFGKRLQVEKQIDRELLTTFVPPMIIQPLLENAIRHGIEPVQEGKIIIVIQEANGNLIIKIINNGKTLSKEDKDKIDKLLTLDNEEKSQTSMGLRNVYQRIKLIYGEQSNLAVCEEDYHTMSTLTIPLTKE